MCSRLRAVDLYRIDVVLAPAVCPDDSAVAFGIRTPNASTRRGYVGAIRVLPLSGGCPAMDVGIPGEHCHSPRWSPDGRTLAFLAPVAGGADQVWLWNRASGDRRPVTRMDRGVAQVDWAPDSRRVVVSASVADGSAADADGSDLIYVTTIREKVESQRTWLPDDRVRKQLLVVDTLSGEAAQITSGPWDHVQPAWSPVRDEIAFVANRAKDADPMVVADIWIVDARGGDLRRLTGEKGPFGNPRWSPDGELLATIGHEHENGRSYQNFLRVWTLRRDGSGRTCRTRDLDATCSDCAISDLREYGGHDPGVLEWSASDGRIYFLASTAGTTQLMSLDVAANSVMPRTAGSHEIYAFAKLHESPDVIVAISAPTVPCDLWRFGQQGGARRLTTLNPWISDVSLASPEPIAISSRDGRTLDGWIMKPVGFDPQRTYPAVMQVHRLMFGATFFFECQLLAAAGFVVFYMNQHGSFGYGQEFALADWSELEIGDLVEGAQSVSALPYIDAKRLGVCGGSNGGYLTYRLLESSGLFAAGVAQRGMADFSSFYGSSDIGYHWTEWILGGPPWASPDAYRQISPLFHVDRIEAPLLIVHSDRDTRVPIEQAEAMFVALRQLGRTVAMARFREEGHDLSRTGKPVNRVARLRAIIGWLTVHLGNADGIPT